MFARSFVPILLVALVGCAGPKEEAAIAPEAIPPRHGQVFESQLKSLIPAEGKVRVSYLGAIRVMQHARFTWRVAATSGTASIQGGQLTSEPGQPALFDLQIVLSRDAKNNVWMTTITEPVAIVDDKGVAKVPPVGPGSNRVQIPNIDKGLELDSLVELKFKGDEVRDIPLSGSNALIVATVDQVQPGAQALPVRLEFVAERP